VTYEGSLSSVHWKFIRRGSIEPHSSRLGLWQVNRESWEESPADYAAEQVVPYDEELGLARERRKPRANKFMRGNARCSNRSKKVKRESGENFTTRRE
jgi:hypothetical protein